MVRTLLVLPGTRMRSTYVFRPIEGAALIENRLSSKEYGYGSLLHCHSCVVLCLDQELE